MGWSKAWVEFLRKPKHRPASAQSPRPLRFRGGNGAGMAAARLDRVPGPEIAVFQARKAFRSVGMASALAKKAIWSCATCSSGQNGSIQSCRNVFFWTEWRNADLRIGFFWTEWRNAELRIGFRASDWLDAELRIAFRASAEAFYDGNIRLSFAE